MLETQNHLQNYIDGFRFNLGFSGKFFHHGSEEENRGDDVLLGKCNKVIFVFIRQWHLNILMSKNLLL